MAMIETPIALKNVDEIAATPGIDALFIGPYDLSDVARRRQGAGRAARRKWSERSTTICVAAQKAGKIAGIYCSDAERALAMAKRGFRFIAVASDLGILRKGAAEI